MKIKKGDTVYIRSGADSGKTGTVTRTFPSEERVVVEGANIKKRHRRARRGSQKGQIVEFAAPVHVSNVSLIDPKTKKPTRVGYRTEQGKKTRIAKQSGSVV
ncbi:MAG: 50S ribosomal protein L24 [Candidatus Lloydbacteria bacterium CG22_combo_CG10-13_8_21_14_all_47_15]|uniref:Large ribosomal subunit protein uL24 n=1 Tax=Candidatus Lloydbacteria bacterium CG22_combo_CG10-13_8_21_14_all_47_15 TaxID=1974635 RepID=A0A2H0CV59_9BACT|nr:MAG: 50S ribosomal protein L24 [Candidatus Lloydbacteria bacterium CG22_combo_CG10-13_8_21_14_all_47_15]